MKSEQFDIIVASRELAITTVLSSKATEYAQGGDRLYNFKEGAEEARQTPKAYLWSLATKHLTNVRDLAHDRLANTEYLANEKIGDFINYLILLEAMLQEEREIAAADAEKFINSDMIED